VIEHYFLVLNIHPETLCVGQALPPNYQLNSSRPPGLWIKIEGEAKVRKITYVTGSKVAGWRLYSKGNGPIPIGLIAGHFLTE
jgi:hypothetical protein